MVVSQIYEFPQINIFISKEINSGTGACLVDCVVVQANPQHAVLSIFHCLGNILFKRSRFSLLTRSC